MTGDKSSLTNSGATFQLILRPVPSRLRDIIAGNFGRTNKK